MTSFWCGVKAAFAAPASRAASAAAMRMVPLTRPAIAANPTATVPSFSGVTPM